MGRKAVTKLSYGVYVLLVLLLAVFTICGSYSGDIKPGNTSLLALLGIFLPVLLIINAFIMLIWIVKKNWLFIIPFVAILWNYRLVTAMLNFSGSSNDTTTKSITVATYNVYGFRGDHTGYIAGQVANLMKKEKVDIICMQEFRLTKELSRKSIDSVFSEYPYSSIPITKEGTELAIYSKFPIISAIICRLGEVDNRAMYVDLKTENGMIRVFNIHLQTTNFNAGRSKLAKKGALGESKSKMAEEMGSMLLNNQAIRAFQAEKVRKAIDGSPYPLIVCGDFNDPPSSYTYKHILGNLSDGFREAGSGYHYTYNGLMRLLRIDYVFHSPTFKCTSYKSVQMKYSDHNPVISVLQ